MKKNFILSMLGVATMLFAASCSSDDAVTDGSSGNQVTASFSITTPGVFTRAAGDGTTVDNVKCVVYGDDGNAIDGLTQTVSISGKHATYTTNLVKGRSYKIVFFAYKDGGAYDVSNLKEVKMEDGNTNEEAYDCFTNVVDISSTETGSAISKTVTLYRPVAQINICTTNEDIAAAKAAGIEVAKSKIDLKGSVYKAFNAYDGTAGTTYDGTVKGSGKVSGPSGDTSFALNDVLKDGSDIAGITLKIDGESEVYKHIGMVYAFVGDYQQKNITEVDYQWQTSGGVSNDPIAKFTNVPVQRNYRTNIYGNILTSPATFNIVVDENFDDDYNYPVTVATANELQNAISEKRENIELGADITVTNEIAPEGKTEINLEGHTLTASGGITAKDASTPITITNGTLDLGSGFLNGISNSNITIDGVNITASVGNAIEIGDDRQTDAKDNTITISNSTITNTGGSGIVLFNTNNKVVIENSTIVHNWFGITQNGNVPGCDITLKNTNITGPYSGIYLSNKETGTKNTLSVDGGTITSEQESAIEVKKTDITVKNATLVSKATSQSYSVSGGGSNAIGYGIALVGYKIGIAYEGTATFDNNKFDLSAGSSAVKIGRYDGTSLVEYTK